MDRYCECGRKVYVTSKQRHVLNRGRGLDGSGLKDHDLCETCWRALLAQAISTQRRQRYAHQTT